MKKGKCVFGFRKKRRLLTKQRFWPKNRDWNREKKPGCRLRLLHGRMTLFEALSVWELSPRGLATEIYVTLTRHPVSSQKENLNWGEAVDIFECMLGVCMSSGYWNVNKQYEPPLFLFHIAKGANFRRNSSFFWEFPCKLNRQWLQNRAAQLGKGSVKIVQCGPLRFPYTSYTRVKGVYNPCKWSYTNPSYNWFSGAHFVAQWVLCFRTSFILWLCLVAKLQHETWNGESTQKFCQGLPFEAWFTFWDR